MQILCNDYIRKVADCSIILINNPLKAKLLHILRDFLLVHQMSLTKKRLTHQDHEIPISISPKPFDKQRSRRAHGILNHNTVEKALQRIILLNPADLVDIPVSFGIDLRLAAKTIEFISKGMV